MLSQQQRTTWDEEGFLVLPKFVRDDEIDTLQRAYDDVWKKLPSTTVVDDLHTNRRTVACLLSSQEKRHRFKVNDLYLENESVRDVVLSERMVPILRDLLGDDPVLCNTLSLNHGTQQGPHADSLFMTPVSDHKLVATWVAMEDGDLSSGPLAYYPGSHKIPIYRFSTGKPNIVVDEFPKWEEHIKTHLQKMGLQEKLFVPKKGDVFIWSAQLIHGGSAIVDPRKTRKSIVSHYFSLTDTKTFEPNIVATNGGFWQNRPTQAISEAEQNRLAHFLEEKNRLGRRSRFVRGVRSSLGVAFDRYGYSDVESSRAFLKQSGKRFLSKARAWVSPNA